ncbi:MAG TPA: hypothetical protein GXX21_02045 [Syntrophomonadaceae bacterium]|nr:hypothetical protein [Syntrophomonadaceae bacterium]HHW28329.1 hypothetical protein [Syntrophomonadaceae bacterium]
MYNYEPLDSMYPEVYYRVYPYVKQMCEMYDNSSNPDLYPYPTREAVEKMTDSIYHRVMAEMKNLSADEEITVKQFERGLFRSLIAILLIRELLRRRRSY